MKKSERVRSLLGPGGLRCWCCGGQGHRRRKSHRQMVRSAVRAERRRQEAEDIADGLEELEALRTERAA